MRIRLFIAGTFNFNRPKLLGFEPSRTRTCDPLVKSQLLYRLSYRPIYMRRAREGVLFSIEEKFDGHSTEQSSRIQMG